MDTSNKIIEHRKNLPRTELPNKVADEGGCGVVGCASSVPIKGKHFLTALDQMKNRGNGKGGGAALLGLDPADWGTTASILKDCYIYQIAYMDTSIIEELEAEFINSSFDVAHRYEVPTIEDYTSIGLEVEPPTVIQYYVTLQSSQLKTFKEELDIEDDRKATDEFIYQNTFRLNTKYYASHGVKQAFVLSHTKNLLVFKLVGYADHVLRYYKLDEISAHVWIGHHRYPTKGTVWHPGGAHPFIGMNEALVHNGDFSNYHAVSEYLAQRNIYPQFLTDTEVAALQFDLYARVYEYPTEYLIEAIAPTTERDFAMLPPMKREVYRQIQLSHLHGSPDGPWFFIIGRSMPEQERIQLLGITDTSMLRPQVFALYETDDLSIGLIGSERQAIDATLRSLSEEDDRFAAKADTYWNARGGSHTDGGAFLFDVDLSGEPTLVTMDKFGNEITKPAVVDNMLYDDLVELLPDNLHKYLARHDTYESLMERLVNHVGNTETLPEVVGLLTAILDSWHLLSNHYNGRNRMLVENFLSRIFRSYPTINKGGFEGVYINNEHRDQLRAPEEEEQYLVMDVAEFPVEGANSAANFIVDAYHLGWKRVLSFDWRGQRFAGSGLGPSSDGFRLDVYGNPGDYLGSGLDGAIVYVHTSAQDQVGQMMKSGKLVIYGDVGQTFLYGAKGGEIYVLGNAAGRPLINAVGKPKLIINGTCLDYLAESFMAGNPLNDGGFAILNGIEFDNQGNVSELDTPYPGGNLFSLASGGAIYIYDPHTKVEDNQLHGVKLVNLMQQDVDLVETYLKENTKLFAFNHYGEKEQIMQYYVKVEPRKLKALTSH